MPLASIKPLVSATHPVIFQVLQSGSFPLISSETSSFPASIPPFETHSGKLDSDTLPVATAALILKRCPNASNPLTGMRSDGKISSA